MKENEDEEENRNDNKENSLIIDEKNEIKIDENEHQNLKLEENIFNAKPNKESYEEQIKYSNENPFRTSSLVGFGITMGGGMAVTPFIYGSTFALTAFSIPGLIISGIGIAVFIPSLIGLGIYKLYKNKKYDNYKKYLDSLKNDKSMKEEREIYLDIINYLKEESINYFEKDYQTQYNNELSKKINDFIENFINKKKKILIN